MSKYMYSTIMKWTDIISKIHGDNIISIVVGG